MLRSQKPEDRSQQLQVQALVACQYFSNQWRSTLLIWLASFLGVEQSVAALVGFQFAPEVLGHRLLRRGWRFGGGQHGRLQR
jgi:hypothetical protein